MGWKSEEPSVETGPGAHTITYPVGTGGSPRVRLVAHLNPAPRMGMRGAVLPHLQGVVVPVNLITSPFTFPLIGSSIWSKAKVSREKKSLIHNALQFVIFT
jgi:hypothetical protein